MTFMFVQLNLFNNFNVIKIFLNVCTLPPPTPPHNDSIDSKGTYITLTILGMKLLAM